MKPVKIKMALIFILACLLVAPQALADSAAHKLVILHTNDFHGHPLKFYHYPAPDVGGLPAIAAFVAQVRAENENVLVLDAGDVNTGRPESNFFKAVPDIIGYNYIGFDAMTLGNHEFDNPLDLLRRQERLAAFPFLSANVKDRNGRRLVRPYMIKTFQGFKVGVFGLTTSETAIVGNPEYVKDVIFEDEVETARQMVRELQGRVDVIIALVHLGLEDDPALGSRRLAANVQGLDLIIDGHTHTDLDRPVYINNIPIVQAWQYGLKVGQGTMVVRDGKVASFSWEAVPINLKKAVKKPDGTTGYEFIGREYAEDEFLLETLAVYGRQVDLLLAEKIGTAADNFFNADSRTKETAVCNLVADSMLWQTRHLKTDFAVQNGGGVRADLPQGDISKKSIYEILPFDNSVVVLKMNGSQVQALFDFIASIPPGKGGFAQVSEGVKFTLDYPAGTCRNITINGAPIDPDRTYIIATNSYLAAGGDGYKVFVEAPYRYDTSVFQRDAAIDYIKYLGGTISPKVSGRIEIVR